MRQKSINYLKAQAGKIRANFSELYTLALISLAIPALVYWYVNLKVALTVFVLIQITLGILKLRQD